MYSKKPPPKVMPRPKTTYGCPARTERFIQNVTKYSEESSPMKLGVAVPYYNPSPANAFLVSEGSYNPSGRKGVTKGDLFAVCAVKKEPVLQVVTTDSVGGQQERVSVPVKTSSEFSFLPSDEVQFSTLHQPIRKWEGVFNCVEELLKLREDQTDPIPAALKVLDNALDHNRQKVPADTILFNIRQVSQRVGLRKRQGIEGVDHIGTVHRFLEGEDALYFSTKLFDVKCSPMYFTKVLQFPQMARVYLHPNTEEELEVMSLQHLTTVTITELSYDEYLMVRKLSDSGGRLEGTPSKDSAGSYLSIPFNAAIEVVGVKLKDSDVMDKILSNRQHSMEPDEAPPPVGVNLYCRNPAGLSTVEEDVEEEHLVKQQVGVKAEGDVDWRWSNPKQRSQSTTAVEERHYQPYVVEEEEKKKKPSQYYNLPLLDASRTYENFKVNSYDNNGSDNERGTSPPGTSSSTEDQYLTMVQTSTEELDDSYEYDYVDSIRMTGSVLQSVLCSKSSPKRQPNAVVSRVPQRAPEDYREAFKGVAVTDSKPLPCHRKPVKTQGKSPRVRSSSQPRSTVSKVPQGQALPFLPFPLEAPVLRHVPTQEMGGVEHCGRHCVAPEPVSGSGSLQACPKESELRYHVAAKLGKDWRSVGTYLELQYYQLDQADVAYSQLENKAMEALVMWLRGQGESEAPRSWETVLKALHCAGRNDMASELERDIRDGTLLQTQQRSSTR